VRIHLDTDLGGDTDDACALAMLLGWPEAEITGITTVADPGGRRAAYVAHLLHLAGRDDIPLAAGAEVSATTLGRADPVDDERHWPASVTPRPAPPGAALDLLERSLATGATLVAIGPYTNLAACAGSRSSSWVAGSSRPRQASRGGGQRWTSTCNGTRELPRWSRPLLG
jgi:purine nucleosidase